MGPTCLFGSSQSQGAFEGTLSQRPDPRLSNPDQVQLCYRYMLGDSARELPWTDYVRTRFQVIWDWKTVVRKLIADSYSELRRRTQLAVHRCAELLHTEAQLRRRLVFRVAPTIEHPEPRLTIQGTRLTIDAAECIELGFIGNCSGDLLNAFFVPTLRVQLQGLPPLVALEFAHPVYERHLRETGLSLTWPRARFPPGAPEWVFYLILQRQWLGTSGTRYRRFE